MPKKENSLRPRYTESDDKVIVESVQSYPQNLSYAFEVAAKRLRRPPDAISGRWYSKLRNDKKVKALAVATPRGVIMGNAKQVARKLNLKEKDKLDLLSELFQSLSLKSKKNALRNFLNL